MKSSHETRDQVNDGTGGIGGIGGIGGMGAMAGTGGTGGIAGIGVLGPNELFEMNATAAPALSRKKPSPK